MMVTRALGWSGIGLGTAQLAAPAAVSRLLGLRSTSTTLTTMRCMGLQEIGLGLGILAAMGGRRSRPVAGDELHANATVTVRRDPHEVYDYWRGLENLPTFMTHLDSVTWVAEGRTHWVADAPLGGRIEWDAEIVQDRPGEMIAWRSVAGSELRNAGTIRFAPAPGDRGTEVAVELEFVPPAGKVGGWAATMLGEHPHQQIRDDLRRFKQVMETGEVMRSDGSPAGLRTWRLLTQRPARPLVRSRPRGRVVDQP